MKNTIIKSGVTWLVIILLAASDLGAARTQASPVPHKTVTDMLKTETYGMAWNSSVGASFNKTKAKKNITVSYKKLSDGVAAIYKNKNSYPVSLTAKMKFLDADKTVIKTLKDYNYCLGAKSTCIIFFPTPYDNDGTGNIVSYSSYKGSFSVAKSEYKSSSQKMTVSSDIQTVLTNFSAVNTTGKKLKNIHISILFYDAAGNILGCKGKYLNCYEKNSTDFFSINHDLSWGTPAKVKIYVDCAY